MQFFPANAGGFEQITSLNTVKTLTIPTGATGVFLQAETQNVRWRADGTAPTSSVGMILYAGDPPTYFSSTGSDALVSLGAMIFIEATASAKINVTYVY